MVLHHIRQHTRSIGVLFLYFPQLLPLKGNRYIPVSSHFTSVYIRQITALMFYQGGYHDDFTYSK